VVSTLKRALGCSRADDPSLCHVVPNSGFPWWLPSHSLALRGPIVLQVFLWPARDAFLCSKAARSSEERALTWSSMQPPCLPPGLVPNSREAMSICPNSGLLSIVEGPVRHQLHLTTAMGTGDLVITVHAYFNF
jgi:hypothetical protein